MPIAKIQLLDGRIAKFEVPEGTTPDEIMEFANSQFSGKSEQPSPVVASLKDPTADMSTSDRVAAGAGKAIQDTWRGFKQIVAPTGFGSSMGSSVGTGIPTGLGTFQPSAEKVQAEIDQSRKLDAPLMDTTAGMAGNIAGNVGMTLPTMFLPGANTYTGSALMGGVLGMLQPISEGESREKNAALASILSAGGFGIGRGFGKLSQAASNKIANIESEVAEKAAKQAAAETASARSASGNAAQNAYRQLEHLRELDALGALTPEQSAVAAQLQKELADKAAEKLLPAAAAKESTAKAFQEAIESESDRAAKITSDKLSNKEVKSQIMARVKRYGPAVVGGMAGNMIFPGLGGMVGGAATGLTLRPAIRSMLNLSKNPAVQRALLSPVAGSGLANNPNLPLALALMNSSIYSGQQ